MSRIEQGKYSCIIINNNYSWSCFLVTSPSPSQNNGILTDDLAGVGNSVLAVGKQADATATHLDKTTGASSVKIAKSLFLPKFLVPL
jgi:hypothetical protein